MSFIVANGLEGFVDGSVQILSRFRADGSLIPSFLNWIGINSLLKGWVYRSVSPAMLGIFLVKALFFINGGVLKSHFLLIHNLVCLSFVLNFKL